jgi:hypothetical protein
MVEILHDNLNLTSENSLHLPRFALLKNLNFLIISANLHHKKLNPVDK